METANYECVRCLFCRTGKEESVVALVEERGWGRALWAKQRGVSPMRQGEPQASLRAMRDDHAELWTRSEAKSAGAEQRAAEGGTVRRCETTMPHCGTVARRSRDGGIDQRGARRPSVAGSFSLAQQHLAIRANRSPLPTGRLPGR